MRVPWTARSSNQSILKEISPGISLEGMMLKLKLQNPSRAPAVFVGRVVARSQEVAQRASALCPATGKARGGIGVRLFLKHSRRSLKTEARGRSRAWPATGRELSAPPTSPGPAGTGRKRDSAGRRSLRAPWGGPESNKQRPSIKNVSSLFHL